MANGKQYFSSRGRYAKGGKTLSTMPADSTANKTVSRVYEKKKEAPKTAAATNKDAVYKLAKQVKSLQNLTHGSLQNRTMDCGLSLLTLPHADQPIAFILNNMYNNQPIFQGLVDPATGLASGIPVDTFNKAVYSSDLQDQYEWNARTSNEQISQVQYKPVFTRLNLKFNAKYAGVSANGRARVTILKLKEGYPGSNKIDVALPDALGAYRNLAVDASDPSRNYFSSKFHNILYDRWITFPNENRTDAEKTAPERYISIPWRYHDNEVCNPDFNQNPTGQQFWTNTPMKDQIWCIISVNKALDAALGNISMSRLDSWRDKHGTHG